MCSLKNNFLVSQKPQGASVAHSSKPRPPFIRLSDVLPPLRSWVRSLYRASDRTWEEFVNTLPKVVGFLRVLLFPPTRKIDNVVRINS